MNVFSLNPRESGDPAATCVGTALRLTEVVTRLRPSYAGTGLPRLDSGVVRAGATPLRPGGTAARVTDCSQTFQDRASVSR